MVDRVGVLNGLCGAGISGEADLIGKFLVVVGDVDVLVLDVEVFVVEVIRGTGR